MGALLGVPFLFVIGQKFGCLSKNNYMGFNNNDNVTTVLDWLLNGTGLCIKQAQSFCIFREMLSVDFLFLTQKCCGVNVRRNKTPYHQCDTRKF